uniref:Nucleoside diphosphate kinase n=2 Tax=Schistosoma mansoni TaxID=6183 RepID=A0A3Q0KQ90_SCHMA
MSKTDPSYCFLVEWFDAISSLIRRFLLIYHTKISSVEMHEEKTNRLFLKPTRIEGLKLSDFYLGSTVTILSRSLKIVDYGDEFTKREFLSRSERCVVFIPPASVFRAGEIIGMLEDKSLRIINLKMMRFTSDELKSLLDNYTILSSIPTLLNELTGKQLIALEVMGTNVCSLLYEFIYGPKGSSENILSNPDLFMITSNVGDSLKQANKIFGNPGGPNFHGAALLKNTTLCVIRPHAVSDGLTGKIWSAINEKGFRVTAARLYRLSKADAADFLEVYKGVVQEYPEMLDQLSSGPCIALEIDIPDPNLNVHQAFREFTGPIDPEIAKYLRPDTLRARFGVTKVKNAIHCTDLPEDTEREVNYFFNNLDK